MAVPPEDRAYNGRLLNKDSIDAANAHNACLDEVARLNKGAKP
jgi:hypothetical protein